MVVYENKKPKLYLNGQYIKSGLTSTKTTVYPSLLFGNVSSYGAYQGLAGRGGDIQSCAYGH